jgi:hypothetical protein
MVDSSVLGLVSTFMVDVLVFVLFLLVYCAIKNWRCKELDPELTPHEHDRIVGERDETIHSVWSAVLEVDDHVIKSYRTWEGLIYLKLHKRLFFTFCVLSVLAFGIIIPIYAQGTSGNSSHDLKQATLVNILFDDGLITSTILGLLAFTAILYYSLLDFYKEIAIMKS